MPKKKQPPPHRIVQTPASALGLLSAAQVSVCLGNVGRSTIYRMVRAGDFPAPDVRLGEKLPRWSVALFNAWVESRRAPGAGGRA